MLKRQTIKANNGETSFEGRMISGCSQCGLLSPLLWNLVVNELLGDKERPGCKVVGYANDLLMIVRR